MAEQIFRRRNPGEKIWWWPNVLTYGRIAAVPILAALLMYGGIAAHWLAFVIYVAAAVTDFFDGYLARIWKQQSALGRMLDPIADKVLVSVVLLALAAEGVLQGGHLWAAIIITAREVLVSGLREFLMELRVSVPVTQIAKWKTTVQLVAIGFLILGPAGEALFPGLLNIGNVLLWVAAALTLYTGYDYFRAGLRHVVDGE
jgi:CDP-diacylglycerol--glycerol-3-phosphate 3-phosphatidyltransferase